LAGYGLGGGFALGVAADVVLLGRESPYSLNFLDLGFTPGMRTTVLLEHVLSPALAHELMFAGEGRLGRDFEGKSGINYVLPRDDIVPKAFDLRGPHRGETSLCVGGSQMRALFVSLAGLRSGPHE
jgi:polyketide biosynthesis enoyl-CoA hydratase PksI